jgi:hypothetical protein
MTVVMMIDTTASGQTNYRLAAELIFDSIDCYSAVAILRIKGMNVRSVLHLD